MYAIKTKKLVHVDLKIILRGDIHTPVAMFNVSLTFGRVGVVDLDARIVAK